MAFSWDKAKKQAIEKKVQRNITMAKTASNDDFKIAHPDWVRDAQSKRFTDLKLKVKQVVERQQAVAQGRRDKFARK